MVLLWRHLHDAVSHADVFRACCRSRQEHFRGRRMTVLFEEVMLSDEDVIISELIGELDLLQRFMVYLEFVLLVPLVGIEWFGGLQLEINAEFHALLSLLKAHVSTRAPGLLGADVRYLYVQPGLLSTWGEDTRLFYGCIPI